MRDLRRGLVVLVALGATGCGVSATDEPVRVADGQLDINSSQQQAVQPPRPEPGADAATLVRQYFTAAVGGGETGLGQVRQFLTSAGRGLVRPPTGKIDIVRLESVQSPVLGPDEVNVVVRYRKVAELNDSGSVKVASAADAESQEHPFVVRAENGQNRIDNPIPNLVLSDTALLDLYERRSVYFWDQTGTLLVPDLLYVPRTLPPLDRANRVVDAVLAGPSDWLKLAVRPPELRETKRKDKISSEGQTLVLNLSAQATGDVPKLRQLMIQLYWSLRQPDVEGIKLLIEGEPKELNDDASTYDGYNYSWTVAGADPSRMQVKDGKLEVASTEPGPGSGTVRLLGSPANQNLVSAAVTLDHSRAVLVQNVGNSRKVYVAHEDSNPGPPKLTGITVSRPEWIPRSNGDAATEALVAVDGKLRLVSENRTGADTVAIGGGLKNVTAVSVSPDGRRLALVADGRAYTAVLVLNPPGGTQPRVSVESRQQLPTEGTAQVTAITWLNEHLLLVAGVQGTQGRLWQATVDGVTLNPEVLATAGIIPQDLIAAPAIPPSSANIVVDVYLKTTGKYRGYFVEKPDVPGRVEAAVEGQPVFPH
jgi:hypothetical protein